ncbi:MAG: ribonuclease HI [Bacteroidia bacterium]
MANPPVVIYTDGAALNNPGPGGYGVVMKYGTLRKELSKGFKKTTNNRMELLAVIEGLRALKRPGLNVVIYSDSKYVVDAVEKKWVFGWQQKNFKGKKNPDLWQEFLKVYPQHKVTFRWVKGHAGNIENERCDELATTAAAQSAFETDFGYEQGI